MWGGVWYKGHDNQMLSCIVVTSIVAPRRQDGAFGRIRKETLLMEDLKHRISDKTLIRKPENAVVIRNVRQCPLSTRMAP